MLDHHMLFKKCFGWYGNKGGIYSIHAMLYFPIFMAVPSADYYLSTKDIYQLFYVRS